MKIRLWSAAIVAVLLTALCSSCKFLPRFYDPPPEIPSDPRELLERELPHITVLNYHFDVTPLDYVSGIVTEEGVLTPAELREKLLGLNAPPEPALAGPVKPGGTALAAPQPERGPQFGFSC